MKSEEFATAILCRSPRPCKGWLRGRRDRPCVCPQRRDVTFAGCGERQGLSPTVGADRDKLCPYGGLGRRGGGIIAGQKNIFCSLGL